MVWRRSAFLAGSFWDMQVGSNGAMACASCHFHAGTDGRTRNTMNPGSDGIFNLHGRPNANVQAADFPFFKISNPEFRPTDPNNPGLSVVISDTDDVIGAQGVPRTSFLDIIAGQNTDRGVPATDRVFQSGRRNLNQLTGRNTPTVINAVFNFANFHDGRANNFFNGQNPFGIQDVNARILVNSGGILQDFDLTLPANRINNAALASQAVGPPLSDVEMSWVGRDFKDVGRKMLQLTPLATQKVHANDSVFSQVNGLINSQGNGLNTSYPAMIEQAFTPQFWNSTETTVDGYSLMEANFSFLFGMAVMMYEATLVSDDTPFDRFADGDPTALTDRQVRGLGIFSGQGACFECHIGAELTGASVGQLTALGEPGVIEVMAMALPPVANYDIGFYNIGVRPPGEDIGRGGRDPFGNPLSFSKQSLIFAGLNADGSLFPEDPIALTFAPPVEHVQGCVPVLNPVDPNLTVICPPNLLEITRAAVDASFKVPGLRNVELTGPYFHNGGMSTLGQIVDFYVRGGDFREQNIDNLAPLPDGINGLRGNKEADHVALVDFLISLTDERVRWEMAPFDHPELRVANGHTTLRAGPPKRSRRPPMPANILTLPAVGAQGRALEGLGPLKPFLAPENVDSLTWHTQ